MPNVEYVSQPSEYVSFSIIPHTNRRSTQGKTADCGILTWKSIKRKRSTQLLRFRKKRRQALYVAWLVDLTSNRNPTRYSPRYLLVSTMLLYTPKSQSKCQRIFNVPSNIPSIAEQNIEESGKPIKWRPSEYGSLYDFGKIRVCFQESALQTAHWIG